jgi:hypothetical protein
MSSIKLRDLERRTDVGIILAPTFCGFYASDNDLEVAFRVEDGWAILKLIQRALGDCVSDMPPAIKGRCLHRFTNLDVVEISMYEDAAFSVREHLEGIELGFNYGLNFEESFPNGEVGGMVVCISREDARLLMGELLKELQDTAKAAELAI